MMIRISDFFFSIKLFFCRLLFRRNDIGNDIPEDLANAHAASIHHKLLVTHSTQCCCFYCIRTFSPDEITEWVDRKEDTALCPYCGIDSVLPDAAGYEPTLEFLSKMNQYWFGQKG